MNKRIGVIGAGGRVTGILEIMRRLEPEIQVVAVFDPAPESVMRLGERLAPEVLVCASEAELCGRTDVDWVFVGSPNACHVSHAAMALEAGHHVFCEKPLATTVEDCHAMAKAVAGHPGRCFFFGLVLRYSPFYRRIKQILDSEEIGKIVSFEFNETLPLHHGGYIHGNWRRHRRVAGTHLLEKCCHDLDLANWFTGSTPVRAAGFAGRDFFKASNSHLDEELGFSGTGGSSALRWPDPDGISPFNDDKDIADNQVAVLEYASGVRATFHTNCNAGIPERRFYICGTRGALRADAQTSVIEVGNGLSSTGIRKENVGCPGGHAGADEPMAEHLIQSIVHGAAPAAGIREALDSTMAALLVDRATDECRVVDSGHLHLCRAS